MAHAMEPIPRNPDLGSDRGTRWQNYVIAVLTSFLVGSFGTSIFKGKDALSEERVRTLINEQTVVLRGEIKDLTKATTDLRIEVEGLNATLAVTLRNRSLRP